MQHIGIECNDKAHRVMPGLAMPLQIKQNKYQERNTDQIV